jgi:hypothetical protein
MLWIDALSYARKLSQDVFGLPKVTLLMCRQKPEHLPESHFHPSGQRRGQANPRKM